MLSNSETIEDDRIVAKCYVELGNVTKEKGEYDESLRYHRKSMQIFERIDDALSVADSHLNIAEIYKAKGELKQAMSEYEIGLTLYEDVYVEDGNKNSDSGTDVSLNSSSFSDLQRTKSLSKSDETLPQTTRKDVSLPSPLHPLNGVNKTSTSSLDLFVPSTKKINEFEDVPQLAISIDDCSAVTSEKLINERRKSRLSSSTSNLQLTNTNDMLSALSPGDLAYETTGETTLDESDILEICAPFLPSIESMNQDLPLLATEHLSRDTKLEDINNSDVSYFCGFLNQNDADRVDEYIEDKTDFEILREKMIRLFSPNGYCTNRSLTSVTIIVLTRSFNHSSA
jgi:hypothetical protein